MRHFTRQTTMRFSIAILMAAGAFGGLRSVDDSHAPSAQPASVEMMQLLHDEHGMVADYVTQRMQASRLANASADADIARAKFAAVGERRQAEAQREAALRARTERKVDPVRTAVRAEQVPVTVAATQAPLQTAVQTAPLPLLPTVAALQAAPQYDGPVRARLRSLVADIRSVPRWFTSAASRATDWVSEAAPELPGLPKRQFSASL